MTGTRPPAIGCVVLTQGRRPDGLRTALASLLAQTGVEADIAVVGNAWAPVGLPEGVRGIERARDEGIPAGRNFGVPAVRGDLVFFLDDDAQLAGADVLATLAAGFAAHPDLGVVQPRVETTDGSPPAREWVPRLRAGDRGRSGDVTHVWEGAVMVRRDVFEQVGGWPEDFRAVHEGVDLGWRVMDAGFRVRYAADVEVRHPPYAGVHNDWDHYYGARNRAWLARRYLPLPFAVPFVGAFALRTLPRLRTTRRRQAALRGYRDGLSRPGARRPLRASTLVRMTRLGRPPVL